MTCFKFPSKTCKELNSLVADFWWEGRNKTHWVAWNKLTRPKVEGGMRIRDFTKFNKALLAKTAWRLLQSPNDLWARVLKGLYFPNGSFIEATHGHRASWCWSSILDGRDFIKDDLCWQIGNGESVRLWHDKWIPSLPSRKLNPISESSQQPNSTVATIISSEGNQWNLNRIAHLVDDHARDAIMAIPLPRAPIEDKIMWTPANNGAYLVKLGYYLASPQRKEGVPPTPQAGPSTPITSDV
ncbi:hypothetical protein QN277_005616 [Acacia crassicarpa]|uniref:Reverse transcriptase zinc-binding domain-containing protein n=1 Tax=Acacia crassicarpa TaxID=499986 RepID=A0AAE1MEF4_9FABA|nr:hypothetical protein QN277_005616 [Acacia crassicarpa]